MHLYEIAHEIQSVLGGGDGEMTDAEFKALDSLEMDFTAKAENVAKFIRGEEAESIAYAAEAKRLIGKANARTNKAKQLKQYLQECMERLGLKTVKGELLKVALQNNPPSVEVFDEAAVPQQFWMESDPTLDKKALLVALKAGDKVAGVNLKQSESVRIR